MGIELNRGVAGDARYLIKVHILAGKNVEGFTGASA
jgi:hypothetical protein